MLPVTKEKSNLAHMLRKSCASNVQLAHVKYNKPSKSRSEAIAMPVICSPSQHGFLPVFSTVGKLYYILILDTTIDDLNGLLFSQI